MEFFQDPPELTNGYRSDPLLQEYLQRQLPPDVLRVTEPDYVELGALGAGDLMRQQQAERLVEPTLTQWGPWGRRIDRIDVTPLWHRAAALSATKGLVAIAYEMPFGEHSRIHQFALNYLVQASLDVYSCPLAMSDGATRTLLTCNNKRLIDHAVPRLVSRDPRTAWTSGQWMTERTGGSDVGRARSIARHTEDGWRLDATKWFSSATTAQMALALARPEGNPEGGRGLALFYIELRDKTGALRNIEVNRLKDKLGTRKVPTAELGLVGTPAEPVAGLDNGVRNIAPMLTITRTWNAAAAAWTMRRACDLARSYATRRVAFGKPLSEHPLHLETLADMEAETQAAFLLAFRVVELLGRCDAGMTTDCENRVLRLITPIAKLTTAKQSVAVASETLEAFGGAGYVEDTGLPRLLADAQVLPIWEGTTNVLSLDVLRALAKDAGTLPAYVHEVTSLLQTTHNVDTLQAPRATAKAALSHATEWFGSASDDTHRLEAGARRFALTLGRTHALALLCNHAAWCTQRGNGTRAVAAARRFATHGTDTLASGIIGSAHDLVAQPD